MNFCASVPLCNHCFLDAFLEHVEHAGRGTFDSNVGVLLRSPSRGNPLSDISDDDLWTWCNTNPSARYPLVARFVIFFVALDGPGEPEWKPFFYKILKSAPDLAAVLGQLGDFMDPSQRGNSVSSILRSYRTLFERLSNHDDDRVRNWANEHYDDLNDRVVVDDNVKKALFERPLDRFE